MLRRNSNGIGRGTCHGLIDTCMRVQVRPVSAARTARAPPVPHPRPPAAGKDAAARRCGFLLLSTPDDASAPAVEMALLPSRPLHTLYMIEDYSCLEEACTEPRLYEYYSAWFDHITPIVQLTDNFQTISNEFQTSFKQFSQQQKCSEMSRLTGMCMF